MKLGTIKQEEAKCRKAFSGVKTGALVQLCHHDTLVEFLTEPPENRIDYILNEKPNKERALRLRLFRPWKWELPADWKKTDADCQKAYEDWQKAYADCQKTYADRKKAYEDWQKAYADWKKTDADCQKTDADWQKAYADLKSYFETEHRKHYPDSPWNGKSIFKEE